MAITQWWPKVNGSSLRADFIAGLTGAILVLPQGVAFAMIAGLPPEYGLYAAMVIPLITAVLGSSLHMISGPTTPMAIVVYAAISQLAAPTTAEYITLALTLTLLVGCIQLLIGLTRMGSVLNFVSHTVIIGFTAGAALLIITKQLKGIFALPVPKGTGFIDTWIFVGSKIAETNWAVFAVAMVTIVVAVIFKMISRKLPFMLIAIVAGSLFAHWIGGASRGITYLGEIKGQLPPLSLPDLSPKTLATLAPGAFAIALLGLIEAISIARSIANKSGQLIDPNQECIGQGASNLLGSYVSCYASSGSFSRSGVNHTAGAETPLSGVFASLLLTGILFLVAPWTTLLPMPVMAGLIVLVGYNLIDWHSIKVLWKASTRETIVLIVTFLATLFMDLQYAIYIGVIFSLLFYLEQTAQPNLITVAPDHSAENRTFINVQNKPLDQCPQLKLTRLDGALYFGSVAHITEQLMELRNSGVKSVLIIGNSIQLIDLAGMEMLVREAEYWRDNGGGLYFSGLRRKARHYFEQAGFMEIIGEDHFFVSKRDAISYIYDKHIDPEVCRTCEVRIFRECG